MKNEIDQLLHELQNMSSKSRKQPENNRSTWECIKSKDWEGAGFADEKEAKSWILEHPYSNLD